MVMTAWLLALASAGWVACEGDGWFEESGEEIDETADEARDELR